MSVNFSSRHIDGVALIPRFKGHFLLFSDKEKRAVISFFRLDLQSTGSARTGLMLRDCAWICSFFLRQFQYCTQPEVITNAFLTDALQLI